MLKFTQQASKSSAFNTNVTQYMIGKVVGEINF